MKQKLKPIAVILTDTHLKDENKDTVIKIFKEARDYAKEHGLTSVNHGGDIFESRKAQTQELLNTFGRILDEFEEAEMQLIVTPGNHDKTDYKLVASFLDPFKDHKALRLIRIPTEIQITKDTSITFAPFFSDAEYIESWDHFVGCGVAKGRKRVCLTHIGMNGSVMNNGMKVASEITAKLFADFDLTLIGHFHDAFDYTPNIKYIGSSIQHNFGERPDKGLTVLYDDLTIETVPMSSPKYLAYEVPVGEVTPKYIAELKERNMMTMDKFKIILTGTEAEVKAFDKHALMAIGVKPVAKVDAINEDELEERLEAFDDKSLFEAFATFCEKNNLNHEDGLKYLNKII